MSRASEIVTPPASAFSTTKLNAFGDVTKGVRDAINGQFVLQELPTTRNLGPNSKRHDLGLETNLLQFFHDHLDKSERQVKFRLSLLIAQDRSSAHGAGSKPASGLKLRPKATQGDQLATAVAITRGIALTGCRRGEIINLHMAESGYRSCIPASPRSDGRQD